MLKVGQTVKIVGNKYPTDNRDVPMDEGRSGHEFNIGDIGVIVKYDENDELQPYNVNIGGAYHSWVATSDIEEVK